MIGKGLFLKEQLEKSFTFRCLENEPQIINCNSPKDNYKKKFEPKTKSN